MRASLRSSARALAIAASIAAFGLSCRARPPGTTTVAPLPDSAFRVRWDSIDLPREMEVGEEAAARITLTNAGNAEWPSLESASPNGDGRFAVRLSSRWLFEGRPVSSYVLRADLRRPLAPSRSITLRLPVRAPAAPGTYELQVDLVQELVAWFGDRGANRETVAIRVH